MHLLPLPDQAGFRHEGAQDGFEIVLYRHLDTGHCLRGATTAVENGVAWSVSYEITLDDEWHTTDVIASSRSPKGDLTLHATRDERSRWVVDGVDRRDLDGCVDIDFESSVVTNTIPVHRLPADGTKHAVPAAFVRAGSLAVERLEQTYRYAGCDGDGHVYDYESSTFDFAARLSYDASGLITIYPGLGRRHPL